MKLTSKINNDIKKVFRLKGSKLDFNTVESLHATLDALDPHNSKENVNAAYHCRPDDEGKLKKFSSRAKCTQYAKYACIYENARRIFSDVYHNCKEVYSVGKNARPKVTPMYTV